MNDYNTWSERDFLNDMWGIPKPTIKKLPPLEELRKKQQVPEFDELANNRLVMGAFRYGPIEDQNFDNYDLTGECKKRLDLFDDDKNLEHLLDGSNMLKLRWYWGRKKGEKFQAIDRKV